jgi:hypothetical protein
MQHLILEGRSWKVLVDTVIKQNPSYSPAVIVNSQFLCSVIQCNQLARTVILGRAVPVLMGRTLGKTTNKKIMLLCNKTEHKVAIEIANYTEYGFYSLPPIGKFTSCSGCDKAAIGYIRLKDHRFFVCASVVARFRLEGYPPLSLVLFPAASV